MRDERLHWRTEAVLVAVHRYWEQEHLPPSVRELMAIAGLSSTSVAGYHLEKLHELGLVSRDKSDVATGAGFRTRSVRLTAAGSAYLKRFGLIASGERAPP